MPSRLAPALREILLCSHLQIITQTTINHKVAVITVKMAVVASGNGGGRQRRQRHMWQWGQPTINQKPAAIAAERVVVAEAMAAATMAAAVAAAAAAAAAMDINYGGSNQTVGAQKLLT